MGCKKKKKKKRKERASSGGGGSYPLGFIGLLGLRWYTDLALLHRPTALLITPITLQMSHFQLHVMTANDPVVQSSL